METTRTRSWDVAPLLLVGLLVGLAGPALAGAGSAWAAAASFLGLALLMTGLVRWRRRSQRREAARAATREPVTGAV